jgi:hypothetical protein
MSCDLARGTRVPRWTFGGALAVAALAIGCGSSDTPAGAEGGHCFPNNTCNAGLTCLSTLCVRPASGTGGASDAAGTIGAAGATGAAGTTGAAGVDGGTGTSTEAGPLGPSLSWTGYVEQYSFPSGSDVIKLTFSTDDHGAAAGAIVLGQGTPPAPATNPDVGYPPDFLHAAQTMSIDGIYIAEGYAYAFDGGTFDGQRLQFKADLAQLWSGWCALQVSPAAGYGPCFLILSGQGGAIVSADLSMCTVNNPFGPGPMLQPDCGKWLLCQGGDGSVCSCTTSGCEANSSMNAVFDLFVTGKTMSGSVQAPFGRNNVMNVHFVEN